MLASRKLWLEKNADRVREYKRKSNRKRYAENPEKFRKAQRDWRRENIEWARERNKRYVKKYAEQRRRSHREYRNSHRNYFRAFNRSQVNNLANWYVRQKMSQGTIVAPKEWPQSLVELKRITIQIKRHLWQRRKTSPN